MIWKRGRDDNTFGPPCTISFSMVQMFLECSHGWWSHLVINRIEFSVLFFSSVVSLVFSHIVISLALVMAGGKVFAITIVGVFENVSEDVNRKKKKTYSLKKQILFFGHAGLQHLGSFDHVLFGDVLKLVLRMAVIYIPSAHLPLILIVCFSRSISFSCWRRVSRPARYTFSNSY